jgi:hypothetical protein
MPCTGIGRFARPTDNTSDNRRYGEDVLDETKELKLIKLKVAVVRISSMTKEETEIQGHREKIQFCVD